MAVKFSNSYKAKVNRISKLPKYIEGILEAQTKKDASSLIKEFKKGIKENSLELWPLKESTIRRKELQGFEEPDFPLYGLGDEDKYFSYMNMLRYKKIKNGYKVYPSKESHWSKRLSLRKLFLVHEFGAIISGKNGTLIRIPPRPALFNAYKNIMQKKSKDKKETSRVVKAAIKDFVNTGRDSLLRKIQDKMESGLSQGEE